MTLKYESEILFDLMKRDGDDTPSDVLPYESELKEKYLQQVEGAYPKLQDYRSEWLNYNLNADLPAEFPVESVSNVTNATFENVVPYAYRSAILKGQTEGMKSVQMPVLTTTGKNLFNPNQKIIQDYCINGANGGIQPLTGYATTDYLKILPNTDYTNYYTNHIAFYDENKNYIKLVATWGNLNGAIITSPSNAHYVRIQLEIKVIPNGDYSKIGFIIGKYDYEPHQSNILTVNEEVELRGIGDVKDELNCLTGELTQNIAKAVLSTFGSYGASTKDGIYFMPKTRVANDISPNHTIIVGANRFISKIESERNENVKIQVSSKEDGTYPTRTELGEYLSQNPLTLCYIPTTSTVKTVDLSCINEQGESVKFSPIEGTMHVSTSSQTLPPLLDMSVPVEATSQNLMSFANIVEEEK